MFNRRTNDRRISDHRMEIEVRDRITDHDLRGATMRIFRGHKGYLINIVFDLLDLIQKLYMQRTELQNRG